VNSQTATVKVYEIDGTLRASQLLNSTASAKATPCLIDCYRYEGTARRPAKEILLRDGDGRVHVLSWRSATSDFADLFAASPFETCTQDRQKDRYGSMATTPSISSYDSDPAYLSLAEVGGCPVIAYYVSPDRDLKCAIRNGNDPGGAWTCVTVDSDNDVGLAPSLRQVDGRAGIVYLNTTAGTLKYTAFPTQLPLLWP